MGRVFECPAVDVVQYEGDRYMKQISSHLLDLLWNKYWVNTLSSSPLLGNRDYVAGQIFDLADKLEQDEGKLAHSRFGMLMPSQRKKEVHKAVTILGAA
ncbi:COP9 signalosome complex subunit 5b [Hordeum vulgare]|nr:COP9 signalosome complex subunit 5b [Hordeum vulgare]